MKKIGKTVDNQNICELTDTEMAFVELAMSLNGTSKKVSTDDKPRKKYKRRSIVGSKRLPRKARFRSHVEVDGQKLTRKEVS